METKKPKPEDIKSLKEDLFEGQKITSCNFLFLDVSSTCTGYAIAAINFETKQANILKAGCLWFKDDWTHQEKYSYMLNAMVTYFWIAEQIDHVVVEQYSVNQNRLSGVLVVPEMTGAIKAGCWENGVKVSSLTPQTWRSQLSIKKDKTLVENKQWKVPTKIRILQDVDVPEKVISNITRNPRQTPWDVYDALGLGLGWLKKFGFKANTKKVQFDTHIGVINN